MMALISSLGTLVASCDSLITSPMADSRSVLHTKICYKITGAYCAAPTCGDWDGDGDLDIIIGFLNETLLFFERSPDTVIGTCTPDEFPCNTNDACDAVSFECSCILGYEGDDCASCSGNCHSAVTDVEVWGKIWGNSIGIGRRLREVAIELPFSIRKPYNSDREAALANFRVAEVNEALRESLSDVLALCQLICIVFVCNHSVAVDGLRWRMTRSVFK